MRDLAWLDSATKILNASATWGDAGVALGMSAGAAKQLANRMRAAGWPVQAKGRGGRPRLPSYPPQEV